MTFSMFSVVGSLNIMELPGVAAYIAKLAYKIAGEEYPDGWQDILEGRAARFHFEFPGSTHAFRVDSDIDGVLENDFQHTAEADHSGKGALQVVAKPLMGGNELRVFHKTYYRPGDFHDSRYDPSFSPILYPGQTLKGCVMVPEDTGFGILACLYVKDGNSGRYLEVTKSELVPGEWCELSFDIPAMEGVCLEEAGVKLIPKGGWNSTLVVYLDDFDFPVHLNILLILPRKEWRCGTDFIRRSASFHI